MLDFILQALFAVLACIGTVHTICWIFVRQAGKNTSVFRLFPVGGSQDEAEKQMSLFYRCRQWETNPSRQILILYDAGMDQKTIGDCEKLAHDTGALFIRTPQELDGLLRKQRYI